MDRRDEALGAVLYPAHRTPGDQREQRSQTFLAREVLLVAEASAHVGRDTARLLVEATGLRDHRGN